MMYIEKLYKDGNEEEAEYQARVCLFDGILFLETLDYRISLSQEMTENLKSYLNDPDAETYEWLQGAEGFMHKKGVDY